MDNGKLKNVKMIVCDIDGTILRSDKTISERTLNTLRSLIEKKIEFCICTGRLPILAQYIFDMFSLKDLVIAANGIIVFDPIKKEILEGKPLNEKQALDILNFSVENKIDCCLMSEDEYMFNKYSISGKKRFESFNEHVKKTGHKQIKLSDIDENGDYLKNKTVYKVLFSALTDYQEKISENYFDERGDISYTTAQKGKLEIGVFGIDKGYGIRAVSKIRNIPIENICAFGDYKNDISMIKEAGIGVAVGNAIDSLKEEADYIADTNDNDGVAKFIEEYIL